MEQFKLVRINTGNAVHLAEFFETPQGVQGYDVYCGSGKTGFRPRLIATYLEVKLENITCKKCQKRYVENMKEIQEQEMDITAELKRMKESGESFYLAK